MIAPKSVEADGGAPVPAPVSANVTVGSGRVAGAEGVERRRTGSSGSLIADASTNVAGGLIGSNMGAVADDDTGARRSSRSRGCRRRCLDRHRGPCRCARLQSGYGARAHGVTRRLDARSGHPAGRSRPSGSCSRRRSTESVDGIDAAEHMRGRIGRRTAAAEGDGRSGVAAAGQSTTTPVTRRTSGRPRSRSRRCRRP